MDVLESDLPGRAVPSGQNPRRKGGGVSRLDLRIQNGKDPFSGGAAGLDQLVKAVETGNRLVKHPDIKEKRDEFSDRHSPLQHGLPTEPEHQAAPQGSHEGHGWVVEGPSPHDFQRGGPNLLGDLLKSFRTLPKPPVGFDLADALQVIHQQGIQCRGSFPLDPVPGMGGDRVPECPGGQKGNRGEGPGGEVGIQPEQDDADTDQLDQGNQTLLNAVDQHPLHVHHVLADAGQQIAAGAVVVPGDRQTLKGGVKVAPQVEDDLLLKQIVQQDSQRIQAVAPQKDQRQHGNQPGKAIAQSLGNDVVDEISGETGINQSQHGGDKGRQKGADGKTGVFPKITSDT